MPQRRREGCPSAIPPLEGPSRLPYVLHEHRRPRRPSLVSLAASLSPILEAWSIRPDCLPLLRGTAIPLWR